MHCEKFEIRLQEVLDARQRPECDEELLAHADLCEHCRELLVAQEQIFAGLEVWEAPPLPADFSARVLAAAAEPIMAVAVPVRSEPRRYRWLGWVAAAALLIAILPIARWFVAPGVAPDVATEPATPATVPQIVVSDSAPKPNAALTPESPTQSLPFSAEQLAAGSEEMLRNLQSLPEVPVDQSVERIPGFRPIANSFGLAISGFRRTLPGGKENPPPAQTKSPPPTKPQADAGRPDDADSLV